MEFLYELNQLQEVTAHMQSALGSLAGVHGALESIRDKTTPFWVGPAQEQFEQNGQTLEKQLENYILLLTDSRQALVEAIGKYTAAEQASERVVRDLSAENIF